MCCLLVSSFLTEITQQIHSLRARGVISSHLARATGSEMRTFRRSAGTLCTAPGEMAFLAMDFILLRYRLTPLHKGTGVPGRSRLRLREGRRHGGVGFQEFGEVEDSLDDSFFANGSVEHELVQMACGPFDMEVALDEIHALLVDTVD